jgi:hypothetical protein
VVRTSRRRLQMSVHEEAAEVLLFLTFADANRKVVPIMQSREQK